MKKAGYLVTGILIGSVLSFSVGAYGAGIVGSKVAGTKDVTVNGKTVGQAVIINDSSYLPVRSLSNALGLGIDLSGGRINLNETEQSSAMSTPVPAATPTPSPSSAPSSTELDDINKQIEVLNSQGRIKLAEAQQYGLKAYANPNDTESKKKYDEGMAAAQEIKSQIEALEKRKAELEGK